VLVAYEAAYLAIGLWLFRRRLSRRWRRTSDPFAREHGVRAAEREQARKRELDVPPPRAAFGT
jgi:hypothetical protein